MVAAQRRDEEGLPVLLRLVALPLAALLLFGLFLHLGFPYDRLAATLATQLSRATQTQIRIGGLVPKLSLAGPGLEASDVTAITRDGAQVQLERAFVRPAWSLAWLRANPALFLDLAGSFGEARGVATLRVPGFHGKLTGIALESLPLASVLPGSSLRGVAELDLDLELGAAGPEGSSDFQAVNGELALPSLPMPVPFTSLAGNLVLGGEQLAELSNFALEGPLVSARANGTLGRAEPIETGELKLVLDLTAQPALRAPLQAAGIALSAEGSARFEVSGTPARPQIR